MNERGGVGGRRARVGGFLVGALVFLGQWGAVLGQGRVAEGGRQGSPCLVGECESRLRLGLGSGKVLPGRSGAYCRLLGAYQRCLAATATPCRGDLKFHSLRSLVRQERAKLRCDELELGLDDGGDSGCLFPFVEADGPARPPLFCSLHARLHLRPLRRPFQHCAFRGAFPLIDNPYLLVQATSGEGGRLGKLTVMVKAVLGCTETLLYEAAAAEALPSGWADGGPAEEGGVVRLAVSSDGSSAVLELAHVDSRVAVLREGDGAAGAWLSVSVRTPEAVAAAGPGATPDWCSGGCGARDGRHAHSSQGLWTELSTEALRNAESFCVSRGLRGDYLDSCALDLARRDRPASAGQRSALAGSSLRAQEALRNLFPNAPRLNRTRLLHTASSSPQSWSSGPLLCLVSILLCLCIAS